jgi:Concanavalin A-like lectin/glucanases superfamily
MTRAINIGSLRNFAIALLGAFILSGCGGGESTSPNPITSGPNAGPNYSGPAPATDDVQAFRINFWENVRGANRCGNCHKAGGQSPQFARSDDVNLAYEAANGIVDRTNPSQSALVLKVAGGHNCWLADANACASILTQWVSKWVGASGGEGTQIQLQEPPVKEPGQSKRFDPNQVPVGFDKVHGLLLSYECNKCHQTTSPTPQQPFFAAANINEAYLAAISKMNLDNPEKSRFVIRLGKESHNCKHACGDDAEEMRKAIAEMAANIPISEVKNTVVSKALTLYDGTIASGGSRFDENVIALYQFKEKLGTKTAFDTSGVEPAADLTLSGDVDFVGGWGINIKAPTTGASKAQASTTSSRKFQQLIGLTGEYTIEAWVIPGNVTQGDTPGGARIVSYSGSNSARNFTMSQTMYNYNFLARNSKTDANGERQLSTADAAERLQASLQHVVMTFDPINGRRIYVNGEFTGDVDPDKGGTLADWDNSFAFVLGSEVSNDPMKQWTGVIRFAAVHNRALNESQIKQNFAAGVGQKYFLLFGISHLIDMPKAYIMFESAQYDSTAYLFTNPKLISLDPAARPGSVTIRGMRIGVNGAEPAIGQAYRLLDTTISDSDYVAGSGAPISRVGTVIGLEHGPEIDEFYLCFDQLGSKMDVCSQFSEGLATAFTPSAKPSDIGVRTFDAINATMASITGVAPNTPAVKNTYANIRQSLPAVNDIQAFLSGHQTSIAQLALQYCSTLVNDASASQTFFPGVNFNSLALPSGQNAIIDPIITKALGTAATEPSTEARTELQALVGDLCPSSCANPARVKQVTIAVCGAALGSAATLVQ